MISKHVAHAPLHNAVRCCVACGPGGRCERSVGDRPPRRTSRNQGQRCGETCACGPGGWGTCQSRSHARSAVSVCVTTRRPWCAQQSPPPHFRLCPAALKHTTRDILRARMPWRRHPRRGSRRGTHPRTHGPGGEWCASARAPACRPPLFTTAQLHRLAVRRSKTHAMPVRINAPIGDAVWAKGAVARGTARVP